VSEKPEEVPGDHQLLLSTYAVFVHLTAFAAQRHLLHSPQDMAVLQVGEFVAPGGLVVRKEAFSGLVRSADFTGVFPYTLTRVLLPR
jgi:hypothetical protein